MAFTVGIKCPECGRQEIPIADFKWYLCPSNPRLDHYAFTCPDCGEQRFVPAKLSDYPAMILAGVQPQDYTPPKEASEPHPRGQLTFDDWLDLISEFQITPTDIPEELK